MTERKAGRYVVDLLKEWKVNHIYGMPGDSINELMEELRIEKEIRFIQIRHEETGALAASAYSKLTEQIGVCLSIAGPGAVHLLNGLYDAKKDKTPVLAIVGQVSSNLVGTDNFQEIKLEPMFEDVAVYSRRVQTADQLPDMVNQAIRTAYAEKGPAVLIVSDDLFAETIERDELITSSTYSAAEVEASQEDLDKGAELLDSAKNPVILAGKGAKGAVKELLAFAEKIKAPLIASLPSKGMIPDDHPQNMGQLGQLGTKPSYDAMQEADLVVLAGTAFPYRAFLPNDTPAIQIDIDPGVIGKYYPTAVGIVGDLKQVLPWLSEHTEKKDDAFLNKYKKKRKQWNQELQENIERVEEQLQPQHVIGEIQEYMQDDAVISLDVGSVTIWTAKYLRMSGQELVLSAWLATMGSALPGAIAAKIAYPKRQVIAIAGDGGFSMGMQDFVTAVKYDLPILMIVFNNQKIQLIEDEQQEAGNRPTETELGNIDYAAFAAACGGQGYTAKNRTELKQALTMARESKKPVLIDAYVEDISSMS